MKKYELINPVDLKKLELSIKDLYICTNHTGKMSGMISISTSPHLNRFCQNRNATKGTVCSNCFAIKQTKRYTNQENLLRKNWEILTTKIYPVEQMPFLNRAFIRLERFGDINNLNQIVNYFNLAKRNPHARFVLWTKNPIYISRAILKGYVKPENLYIILSSFYLNKVDEKQLKKYADFIDAVFTVYDKKFIAGNQVEINCGARHCLSCMQCYSLEHGRVKFINEELK